MDCGLDSACAVGIVKVQNLRIVHEASFLIRPILCDAEFLVAHKASFDQSVLRTCCESAGIRPPDLAFHCTMRIARQVWGIYPTRLPDVCCSLGVPLDHHDPLSDARACAQIFIRALKLGVFPRSYWVSLGIRRKGDVALYCGQEQNGIIMRRERLIAFLI
jgi:DNA polymerase-3 subunit epsilon